MKNENENIESLDVNPGNVNTNNSSEQNIQNIDQTAMPSSSAVNNSYNASSFPTTPLTSGIDPAPLGVVSPDNKVDVGIIPPKKVEPKKNPGKKVLFVLLILVLLAGVAYGIYYVLAQANSKSKVTTKTITVELGSTLSTNPAEYATFKGVSATNCTINLSSVDNKKSDVYDYMISCGKDNYTGKIVVQDTIKPEVSSQNLIKMVNETVEAKDFINSCKDETECSYEFNDAEAIKSYLATAGDYVVAIKVSDTSNNTVIVNANLQVISASIASYLECSSPAQLIDESAGISFIVDRLAFDETNTFLGITERINKYTFLKSEAYAASKEKNTSSNTYEGISGKVEFNDNSYTVTVTNSISIETLKSEYNDTFPSDYATIKAYYESKSYSCKTNNNNE